jgi:hypothetical protein
MFKSFATAMISATVASTDLPVVTGGLTFGPESIPQYVAGLIYALVDDNQLSEIETCFKVSADVETQFKLVIEDFAQGHIIHALEDLGDMASMLPPCVATCQGMQDDF